MNKVSIEFCIFSANLLRLIASGTFSEQSIATRRAQPEHFLAFSADVLSVLGGQKLLPQSSPRKVAEFAETQSTA